MDGLTQGTRHHSELAGTIATLELRAGAAKKAKKLFRIALADPTENTMAQAASLSSELGAIEELMPIHRPSHLYEADARIALRDKEYKKALLATWKWLRFQPFSAAPANHGAYLASVALSDFQEGLKISEFGRLASPNDTMLLNNSAFALASMDRIPEAQERLKLIRFELLAPATATPFCDPRLVAFRRKA